MNILIVAATNFEVVSEKISKRNILITGVGMVNTAIKMTDALVKKHYDLVINIGVAGSFSAELKVGDVVEVIEDNFSEVGFETGLGFSKFKSFELQTKYLNKSRTSLKKVKGITVNTVHGNHNTICDIIKRENPDIESMEGASVFKVCEELNIPCIQVRSISNKVESRNKLNWDLDLAIKNLNVAVEKILENL